MIANISATAKHVISRADAGHAFSSARFTAKGVSWVSELWGKFSQGSKS